VEVRVAGWVECVGHQDFLGWHAELSIVQLSLQDGKMFEYRCSKTPPLDKVDASDSVIYFHTHFSVLSYTIYLIYLHFLGQDAALSITQDSLDTNRKEGSSCHE
jgi:hypothetical protein